MSIGHKNNAKTLGIDDITIVDQVKLKKAITAAALGNAMEWFDFGVYGFIAVTLGHVFFPEASGAVQVLATLATFAVAFLVRPLGGLFFGAIGDKVGRQKVLAATIILMAVSTFCIGLIPSYASIGIMAPILLLICRLCQGFSTGGEYCGAATFIAEYSPDSKRGFLGSWLDFGSIGGYVLGAAVVLLLSSLLTEAQLLNWGWRIPFFIAAPLGIIGMYLRSALDETPAFQQHLDQLATQSQAQQEEQALSFKQMVTKLWQPLLICMSFVLVTNVTYYMLLSYMPSYLSYSLNYSLNHGVLIILVVMLGMLVFQPLMGMLSDKIGRKPIIFTGCIGLFIFAIPCFYLINTNQVGLIFVGLMLLALLLNTFTGVMASTLPAIFPTKVRYSALAISFNLSVSLFGGTTPLVAAWLVESTQNLMMPAYYLMVVAVIGGVAMLFMKETANKPLRGSAPAAADADEAVVLLQAHHDLIEQKVDDLSEQIAALETKKQRLINQHPKLD